jgi:uncharacterized protein (TIGR02265 family)
VSRTRASLPYAERLIFPIPIEGLWVRALSRDLTPALRERLCAEGLDLEAPLAPAYPLERFETWLHLTAAGLRPDLPESEGVRWLGRRFLEGYQQTLVGKATSATLKLLGVRRSVDRLTRTFATGDNFMSAEGFDEAPGVVRVEVGPIGRQAHYVHGLLEGGLSMVGAREGSVEYTGTGAEERAVYRMSWRA